ncbi:hypothetical protein Taro_039129, partial [Colocasia esculenta]|nr:hypothetical protein [Colocasia esculenta]
MTNVNICRWGNICFAYLLIDKVFCIFTGICLKILVECKDIPILGVCLGHQALGYVHGAQIIHAPEPVHGRLSEIEHAGCNLFLDIPSGSKSGFKGCQWAGLGLGLYEPGPGPTHQYASPSSAQARAMSGRAGPDL